MLSATCHHRMRTHARTLNRSPFLNAMMQRPVKKPPLVGYCLACWQQDQNNADRVSAHGLPCCMLSLEAAIVHYPTGRTHTGWT
jgi:hypothetical protein